MKQLQQQQPNDKTNIQGMTGTPMVAASPERHDGGLQANPVEVQSYQPPWKVLSDFALQSDIDQPAFQQLVNFSEGGPGSNSTGSEVASMSSQLPDTPNSMVASPIEAWGKFIQSSDVVSALTLNPIGESGEVIVFGLRNLGGKSIYQPFNEPGKEPLHETNGVMFEKRR